MPITKPILPAKSGYVERIDAYGNHYYAPTTETKEKKNFKSIQADTDAMLVDYEYRITMLELGLNE